MSMCVTWKSMEIECHGNYQMETIMELYSIGN